MLETMQSKAMNLIKNKYGCTILICVLAHMFILPLVINILSPSYGAGLLLFWTYIWMVDCYDSDTTSGYMQALVCGPIGWILIPDCLSPIALERSLKNLDKESRFTWDIAVASAHKLSDCLKTIRKTFMSQLTFEGREKSEGTFDSLSDIPSDDYPIGKKTLPSTSKKDGEMNEN